MKWSRPIKPIRKHFNRVGSAMVEMAVCFPVFLLILMGIIEFGRAMSVNQMLNSSARIGCRSATLDGSSNSSVTNVVPKHVANTLGCQQSNVTVAITTTSSQNGSILSDVSSAKTGDLIDLDVSVLFSELVRQTLYRICPHSRRVLNATRIERRPPRELTRG